MNNGKDHADNKFEMEVISIVEYLNLQHWDYSVGLTLAVASNHGVVLNDFVP